MSDNRPHNPFRQIDPKTLRKKIHRALVEARNARHNGDEQEVRRIVQDIMREAAPAAVKASREGGVNWVVEALKPLDELLLPDHEE